jgi:hypothetical protein
VRVKAGRWRMNRHAWIPSSRIVSMNRLMASAPSRGEVSGRASP